MYSNLTTNL